MDSKTEKAFELYAEAAKQLLTLATGIIAFTVTFFSTTFVGDISDTAKIFAGLAWLFYILSIVFGIMTLLALSGELDPKSPEKATLPTINAKAVKNASRLQQICFIIGLVITMFFGAATLLSSKHKVSKNITAAQPITAPDRLQSARPSLPFGGG